MKLDIKKLFINYNYTKRSSRKIDYIVIHYTAGTTSRNGAAYNTIKNTFNKASTKASAHYVIDDYNIYNCVENNNVAWHCGANKYIHPLCRNSNSIGIEICSNHDNFKGYNSTPSTDSGWYITPKSKTNAAKLTAYLLQEYNLSIDKVIRHYDVTGKDCPSPWVDNNKEGYVGWTKFLEEVKRYMNEEEEVEVIKYNTIEECPEWSREAIKYLMDNGYLKELNLSLEMVRMLVIAYRILTKKGV